MTFRRKWIAVVVCLTCLANLSPAGAQSIDDIELLLLEEAPSEPREVGVGIQINQVKFVDQKAENFGVVGTLRLEWHDPKLAFDADETARDYKVYERDGFRKFTARNSIFYPGFVIKTQRKLIDGGISQGPQS